MLDNQHTPSFFETAKAWLYARRRKLATFGVGLLACVLGYHVMFGANGLVVYSQKKAESRQVQEQNRALQQQNQEMEEQIKKLKSDPQTIEKEAREKLHYVRPDEKIYSLPQKPPDHK